MTIRSRTKLAAPEGDESQDQQTNQPSAEDVARSREAAETIEAPAEDKIDDGAATARTKGVTDEEEGDDEPAPKRGKQGPSEKEKARAAIAKKFSAKRSGDEEALAALDEDADERQEEEEPAPELRAPSGKKDTEQRPDAAANDDREVTVKVGGVDVRMNLSDALKKAGESLSARTEAQPETRPAAADNGSRGAPTDRNSDRRDAKDKTLDDRRERLGKLAETMLVGSPEEVATKLGEVLDEVETRAEERARAATASTVVSTKMADELGTAMRTFAGEYKDVLGDEDRAAAFASRTQRAIVDTIAQAGGLNEQEVAELRRNPSQIGLAYRGAVRMGLKVKDPLTIFREAGKAIRENFGGKASTDQLRVTVDPNRVDRKRALEPQPRSAGPRVGLGVQEPKRKSPSDVVAQMRRSRGQT